MKWVRTYENKKKTRQKLNIVNLQLILEYNYCLLLHKTALRRCCMQCILHKNKPVRRAIFDALCTTPSRLRLQEINSMQREKKIKFNSAKIIRIMLEV